MNSYEYISDHNFMFQCSQIRESSTYNTTKSLYVIVESVSNSLSKMSS